MCNNKKAVIRIKISAVEKNLFLPSNQVKTSKATLLAITEK